MEKPVKHHGCHDCQSREQEVLVSTYVPGDTVGVAVCDACRARRGAKE
jgi:hypothetical protein